MFSCTTQFGVLPLLHSCCCFFCVPVPELKIFCFQSKNDAHTHSHKHKQARSVSPHTTTNHTKVSSQKKKEKKKNFPSRRKFCSGRRRKTRFRNHLHPAAGSGHRTREPIRVGIACRKSRKTRHKICPAGRRRWASKTKLEEGKKERQQE